MKLILHSNLIIMDPDPDVERQCVNDLTIPNPKYFLNKKLGIFYNREPENLFLFIKQGNALILPRGYDISQWWPRFSEVENLMTQPSHALTFNDDMTPYQFQDDAADEFIKHGQGGIIAPCGAGKTEIAINIINKLRVPTLIVVHKTDLLEQWQDRIKSRLNYDPGIIGASRSVVKDVTIATVQSLYSQQGLVKYSDPFYNKFAMVILDEAHHAPARSWTVVLGKCPAMYRLWLTATENRKDGLGKTIPLSCGKIIYRIEHNHLLKIGRIVEPTYIKHDLRYIQGNFTKKVLVDGVSTEIIDRINLDRALFSNHQRNSYICDQIVKDFQANKVILAISPKSVVHCEIIHNMLLARGIASKLLVGKIDVKSRKEMFDLARQGLLRCIVATNVAEEGLDIPRLDCLHLMYPMTDIEQAAGRVMRSCSQKTSTEIHDYIDIGVEYLRNRALKRQRFFNKLS